MSTFTSTNGRIDTREEVAEGTPYSLDCAFTDEDEVAYTPASVISMKVYDSAGDLKETHADIAAASTIEVTTAAATNAVAAGLLQRIILLEWTAITTRFAAPGVPQKCEIHYSIKDLATVPAPT